MKKIIILSIFWVISCFAMQKQELVPSLDELIVRLKNLEQALKGENKKSGFDIFQEMNIFSKLLDDFSKNPSQENVDAAIEQLLDKLLFDNVIEYLDLPQLRKLRTALNDMFEKIQKINQNIKGRGVDLAVQQDFYDMVFETFAREKEVLDAYIDQKNREFQQTLFDESITNVRNKLIKFQQDPTVITLSRLSNSLKFNIQFLDVVDRLDVLSGIFMKFNQLVKDVENTFRNPSPALQNLAKKTGRAAWIQKLKKEIFGSLHETQEKLRKYLKNRLEAAQKEKIENIIN